MIVLIRLEAENLTMQDLLADLDKAEEAVRTLEQDGAGVLPNNNAITDEHYERMKGSETYFKGRRVLKFVGRAQWDDNSDLDRPQPRLASALTPPGVNATASANDVTSTLRFGA